MSEYRDLPLFLRAAAAVLRENSISTEIPPDLEKAANAIEQLQAELRELRGRLEDVVNALDLKRGCGPTAFEMLRSRIAELEGLLREMLDLAGNECLCKEYFNGCPVCKVQQALQRAEGV